VYNLTLHISSKAHYVIMLSDVCVAPELATFIQS